MEPAEALEECAQNQRTGTDKNEISGDSNSYTSNFQKDNAERTSEYSIDSKSDKFDVFSIKSHLNELPHTQSSKEQFICNICLKSFAQKSKLTQHILIHSDEKQFKCMFVQKHSIGNPV